MRVFASILVFAAVNSFVIAQEPPPEPPPVIRDADLLLPSARRSVLVQPAERNPFGHMQIQAPTDFGMPAGDTEEGRLRAMILQMPVRGVAAGRQGASTVFLGPLAIAEGQDLPPLMPSQLERIFVREISADKIIFAFRDRAGSTSDRAFSRMFDLKPRVRYVLPGDVQDSAAAGRSAPLRGIAAEGDEAR